MGEEDYTVSMRGFLFLLAGLSSSAKGSKLVGLGTQSANTAIQTMRAVVDSGIATETLLLSASHPNITLELRDNACFLSAFIDAVPTPWKLPVGRALAGRESKAPTHLALIACRLIEYVTMERASREAKQHIREVVCAVLLALADVLDVQLAGVLDNNMSGMPLRPSASGRARPIEHSVKTAVAKATFGSSSKRSFLQGASWVSRKRQKRVGGTSEIAHNPAAFPRYLDAAMHGYWLAARQISSSLRCVTVSFDGVKRANGEELLTLVVSLGSREEAFWLPVQEPCCSSAHCLSLVSDIDSCTTEGKHFSQTASNQNLGRFRQFLLTSASCNGVYVTVWHNELQSAALQ
eukprot:1888051-Amphidinium_carterae.2